MTESLMSTSLLAVLNIQLILAKMHTCLSKYMSSSFFRLCCTEYRNTEYKKNDFS